MRPTSYIGIGHFSTAPASPGVKSRKGRLPSARGTVRLPRVNPPVTSLAHDSPALARAYDRLSDSQFAGGQRLVGRLELEPGDRVLDVGCGTGRLARHIADITGPQFVSGVDPLVDRVEVARTHHPGISFSVGSAEDLGAFRDASLEAVTMSAVFHWVQDKPRALAEVRRVLGRGGRLGLTTPAKELRGESTTAKVCAPLLGCPRFSDRLNPGGFGVARMGCTVTELLTLFSEARLDVLELHVVRRVQAFATGEDVVDFLESSSFGNFLLLVTEDARPAFRAELAAAFDATRGPNGITLVDHGVMAVASRGA